MSIDFEKAVEIAKDNAKKLLPSAKNFILEGVIEDHGNFEVKLSYLIQGSKPGDEFASKDLTGMGAIMEMLATRRTQKIFIISKSGEFKGFKNTKD